MALAQLSIAPGSPPNGGRAAGGWYAGRSIQAEHVDRFISSARNQPLSAGVNRQGRENRCREKGRAIERSERAAIGVHAEYQYAAGRPGGYVEEVPAPIKRRVVGSHAGQKRNAGHRASTCRLWHRRSRPECHWPPVRCWHRETSPRDEVSTRSRSRRRLPSEKMATRARE